MNSYEKSLALGLTGTDTEQVAVLKSITLNPTPTVALSNYLLVNGLLFVGSGMTAKGTLSDIVSDTFDKLFSALYTDASASINSHTQEWGPEFSTTIDGLVAVGKITQEQADAVYALGGGRPYITLAEAEFAQQRTDAEALISRQAIINTAKARTTAIAGWLDVYDITGKTDAEVQAYVDDLFSTPDGNPSGGV